MQIKIAFLSNCPQYPLHVLKRAFRSEISLLDFLSKDFDRSEDQLYQISSFYDLSFLRYNELDLPLEMLFPLRNFARVAN